MKKIIAVILFSFILFIGCKDDQEEEDDSVGQITITGIPDEIPVMNNESNKRPVFKVYLNASNSKSEYVHPVAKGVKEITSNMKPVNRKYTVTINLQNANPKDDKDPNKNTGPWFGTARYFSVMISPNDVSNGGVNTIWVRAGTTLDKGMAICDWEDLQDFRKFIKEDPNDELEYGKKAAALFNDIVCADPDITGKP